MKHDARNALTATIVISLGAFFGLFTLDPLGTVLGMVLFFSAYLYTVKKSSGV